MAQSSKSVCGKVADAMRVREFTAGAGQPVPAKPVVMAPEQVFFLAKMMLDEIMEFTATVAGPEESKTKLKGFIDQSKDIPQGDYDDEVEKIAEQADALVDSYYYSLNAAARHGINLSALFDTVHAANMAKRCPKTGEFLKRDDGKIIKPEGWQPPDVRGEIARQLSQGSFSGANELWASDAMRVREFTAGAGQPVPAKPVVMAPEQVFFLAKMMLDEIMEFTATVAGPEESKTKLKGFIDQSKDIPQGEYDDEVEKIAEQADALVDSYYYSLNAAARHGINLSALFDTVHAANMAKRCPKTGEFLKRDDGKIIKPEGWQPPDVRGEIARQLKDGAWWLVAEPTTVASSA